MWFLGVCCLQQMSFQIVSLHWASAWGHELGQISYIFSDKTGTLTQNVMELKRHLLRGIRCTCEQYLKSSRGLCGIHLLGSHDANCDFSSWCFRSVDYFDIATMIDQFCQNNPSLYHIMLDWDERRQKDIQNACLEMSIFLGRHINA